MRESPPGEAAVASRGDSCETRVVTSPATIEIRLLGEATVRADGTRIEAFDSPRLLELVARLVLQDGTPVDRPSLAYALWPDSSDTQARTNLRHLLHDLRRALPDI